MAALIFALRIYNYLCGAYNVIQLTFYCLLVDTQFNAIISSLPGLNVTVL